MNAKYLEIIEHYERCLEKHGDNHLGVDWPKLEDVDKRYKVMLEVINLDSHKTGEKISILDFGCGTAHLYEYMLKNNYLHFDYAGLDLSPKFIEVSAKKFPHNKFYCGDILTNESLFPNYDYIILNGVFTEKRSLSFDEMWTYFTRMITVLYTKCNRGLALNVMSKNVDWERVDLFHLPLDQLSRFLCKEISRNFVVRNDYGLFEYTVYIYKK